jgi:hypothetical protein
MQKATLLLVFVLLILLAVGTVGCAQKEVQPILKLDIQNVKICSNINYMGDYTVQPDATFDRGDGVWLYFEAHGMTVKQVDDKFECWVRFSDFKIFDPNSDMIEHPVDIGDIHETDLDEIPNYIWLWGFFGSTTDDAVGQYRWEFTVEDELSGAIGTGSANFTLSTALAQW